MQSRITAVLCLLFAVSITVLLLFFRASREGTIEFEVAKALLQVGLVSVAGAVLSLLVSTHEHRCNAAEKRRDLVRQRCERDAELQRSILKRAMTAYNQTKKTRRMARARAISGEEGAEVVHLGEYDKCLDILNGAQLEFESLATDVATGRNAFRNTTPLIDDMKSLEKYLGKLITEYEEGRRRFSGAERSLPLSNLSALADFVSRKKESLFRSEFAKRYHKVQRCIWADLLHPSTRLRGETATSADRLKTWRSCRGVTVIWS